MAYETVEQIPNDVREKLPEGAQNIFRAAFNSASEDGLNEQEATQVAWNSIRVSYVQGEDGKWQPRPEEKTDHKPIGNMGAA
ncbi:ChaB family protein [Gloeothece verrucosa]|uniref:ChaB family protein n=1 Tax=Gloeothece verrucosa (strain PCC 7822) TaxID=497965 RepID=E0U9C4_GLOV7|nr:ChaB family protein [Gloeothece verrucosa]ADN12616.1 ChaB family protein [Gloeothece verrucosa PCC 7822]